VTDLFLCQGRGLDAHASGVDRGDRYELQIGIEVDANTEGRPDPPKRGHLFCDSNENLGLGRRDAAKS